MTCPAIVDLLARCAVAGWPEFIRQRVAARSAYRPDVNILFVQQRSDDQAEVQPEPIVPAGKGQTGELLGLADPGVERLAMDVQRGGGLRDVAGPIRPGRLGLAVTLEFLGPLAVALAASRRVSARFFGVFMSVNPVLAALLGLVILQQPLPVFDWLAIAAIVAANAVSIMTAGRRARDLDNRKAGQVPHPSSAQRAA